VLLSAPARLDASGVEALLDAARRGGQRAAGLDCSTVRFIDPCGTLALLAIGLAAAWRGGSAWGLVLPRDPGPLAWLERCGARELLERSFVVEGSRGGPGPDGADPTLLAVTVVRSPDEVRGAVGRLKARADLLLVSRLGHSPLTADRLTVAVAELLQNAVDHSGSPGLAAACWYARGSRGAPELRLAVADVGVGVRESLAARYATGAGRTWDDATAVRTAFREGVSRFEDPGRGLGLKAVAATVRAWGGSLRLRSGTAAGGVDPGGPGEAPCERLASFPGTQVDLVLPHADPSSL